MSRLHGNAGPDGEDYKLLSSSKVFPSLEALLTHSKEPQYSKQEKNACPVPLRSYMFNDASRAVIPKGLLASDYVAPDPSQPAKYDAANKASAGSNGYVEVDPAQTSGGDAPGLYGPLATLGGGDADDPYGPLAALQNNTEDDSELLYGPLPVLSAVEKIYDDVPEDGDGAAAGGADAVITFTPAERERCATVWAKEHGVGAGGAGGAPGAKVMTLKKGGLSANKGKR